MQSAELIARLRAVRMLTLDVDGVQTDGGLYYSETGAELRKFNVRDGVGIKRVMALGIPVAFLTASATPCIAARARKLGVTYCLAGIEDKLAVLGGLCAELGLGLDEVAHMGDDVNDLEVLRAVGLPLTVADAVPEVAACALWTSHRPGGAGAVREFCDLLAEHAAPATPSTASTPIPA